ncbi:DUF2190 family protein [Sagittula stellata]|uniref:RecA/RadA recombinase n=1 Tax=Sagittula stellata (strain ATCC 700073 / DSM 11524 / E-37) TaxID=388399 RepID=A3K1Z8_SAGS3|nr:DUF2190 family protein [Sagittula stellata]EBA08944.1 hypothetical protein SSE37_04840 [Sagittula stellata E-37]
MKSYVQDGDKVVVAAPRALTSGEGALVGSMFGVAEGDAESGADVVLVTTGVVDIAKVGSQAWTVGAKVYWDNTNFRTTTVVSSNTLIGVAMAAVGSGAGDTTGQVRLNGSF